jgi:PhnB protein
MSVKSLNPYLNFAGTAAAAIQLYESALGAVTQNVMRFADAPGMKVPDNQKNFIMHAHLRIGDSVIMISDTTQGTVSPGENVQVALHFTDVDSMAKAFDALAAGGKVTLPLQDMFWGARFGMLTDAHGILWMFSCELKKP